MFVVTADSTLMNDSFGHGNAVSILCLEYVLTHYKLFSIAPIIAEILSDPIVISGRAGLFQLLVKKL